MYNVGDTVKVLAPFKEAFPDVYTVTEVVHNSGDNSTVYILGDAGGFDAVYLEDA